MIPNLENKRFAIFGLQQSGKSYLAKHILTQSPYYHFVYDTLDEHEGYNRYTPRYRQYMPAAIEELNRLIEVVVLKSKKIRLFIIDEANRYCPPKPTPLPDQVAQLNDFQAHFNIGFGVIARRPVQLHSDLVELAHYLFIFNLAGKNDHEYLNSLAAGLGDQVASLEQYHFAIVDQQRNITLHEPI